MGAGRRGGAAGWLVRRVGGRRRGARPGCRGRLAQREPAPGSALQPRALSISRRTRDKGGFMSKGRAVVWVPGTGREEATAPSATKGRVAVLRTPRAYTWTHAYQVAPIWRHGLRKRHTQKLGEIWRPRCLGKAPAGAPQDTHTHE